MPRYRSAELVPESAAGSSSSEAGRDDCRWVVVLAGGSGTRLAALTSDGRGGSVPKQYCSLVGGRSLLGDALVRGGQLVSRKRVVTVVARQHERFWRRELLGSPQQNVVVQPQNRGTAAGILLPLLAIIGRDPQAQVTLMPSDHFVADEAALAGALRVAQRSVDHNQDRVLLVGIEPDGPEVDYGWILPGACEGAVRAVREFVEKPNRNIALDLLKAGAVWNSFLMVGSAVAILQLYAERLPDLLAAFVEAELDSDPSNAERLYGNLGDADFCRDLLTGSESRLGLCVAPACGWTDLGTPARVAQCALPLMRTKGIGVAGAGSLASACNRLLASSSRGPSEAVEHHA